MRIVKTRKWSDKFVILAAFYLFLSFILFLLYLSMRIGDKMAFLDFFWKKVKNLAGTSVQETLFGISRPLAEISSLLA